MIFIAKKVLVFVLFTPVVVAWSILGMINTVSGFLLATAEYILNRAMAWARI